MAKSATAFSPAGISSFFEICDQTPDGKPIADPERVGARGGGFGLVKGVLTKVNIEEADSASIRVVINGKDSPEAKTTKTVVKTLLQRVDKEYEVTVKHRIEVPIGAGFGTSAGGALGTAFALSHALGIHLSYNQLGRIAHVADIKCRTGLGTVGPLLLGGCVVTLEPGGPGYALIDRIPITSEHMIVAGVFKPWPKKEVLTAPEKREKVNKWGRKTLNEILAEPSLENFMRCCEKFALKTGLATPRVTKLMDSVEKAGAVGAAQNMLGEAVHALVEKNKVKHVVEVFEKVLPQDKIVVAQISLQGASLLT